MLLKIGLVVLGFLALYGLICIFDELRKKSTDSGLPPLKLVVVLKDQEDGVEFFIRRIMAEGRRRVLGLDVVVIDTGSSDDTLQILRRMSYMFGFKLKELNSDVDKEQLAKLSRGENNGAVRNKDSLSSRQPIFYYDARGMTGMDLARAPLFQLLSTQA